jgi:hypothetical protein
MCFTAILYDCSRDICQHSMERGIKVTRKPVVGLDAAEGGERMLVLGRHISRCQYRRLQSLHAITEYFRPCLPESEASGTMHDRRR